MNIVYYVGVVLILWLGWRYFVVSLRLRKKLWQPADARFQQFDLGDLPPDLVSAFHSAAQQLVSLGFSAIAHLKNREDTKGQDSAISLWTNELQGDVAQVIVVRVRGNGARKTFPATAFRQDYDDGTGLATISRTKSAVLPKDPSIDAVVCSGIWDLCRLYEFHKARTAGCQSGRIPQVPAVGQGCEYQAGLWTRTYSRLCESGYYRLSADRDRYVPTLKGTFLMTWRLFWPWKQLRLRARDRRANHELRRLGFGGLVQFRAGQTVFLPQPSAPVPVAVFLEHPPASHD